MSGKADIIKDAMSGLGYSVLGKGGSAIASGNARQPLLLGRHLSIPLRGSAAEFEEAIFKDLKGLPLVNFIFTFQSYTPWEIGQSALVQLAGFADLINDINETKEYSDYFGGVWDFLKEMGQGFINGSKLFDSSKYGMTVFFDPSDSILPDVMETSLSMSLKNQLTYSLSFSRLQKYSVKWWFDEDKGTLEVDL